MEARRAIKQNEDDFDADVSKWDDIDDDEILNAMLSADEVAEKTRVWTEINREYLDQQELKRKQKENEADTKKVTWVGYKNSPKDGRCNVKQVLQ